MITTCKIVVIMLFALFFLSSNCRQMAIEAAQLRTWTLQPDFSGSRAHGVSQDSSVLVGYDNLEAANAKTRGVNDIERKFAEHQGEENTAGTPEEHRSLKRSLLLVSGARPSMKLGSQNKFSGTQEAISCSRTLCNIPETSKARPIEEVAAMTPPQPEGDQDVGDLINAMDYAPAHNKPPIHN